MSRRPMGTIRYALDSNTRVSSVLPHLGRGDHFARRGGRDQTRDHTTVINTDRKIRSLMAERRSIYTQVTELTNRIKQQARTG